VLCSGHPTTLARPCFSIGIVQSLQRGRVASITRERRGGHLIWNQPAPPIVPRDTLGSMTTEQPWPWPRTMDALVAAPASHRVIMENSQVRVLDVVIEPGNREPEHTHEAASVMIVDEPARIRYYEGDALRFESPERLESPVGVRVRWMEPEGPHSVENIDECRYHAIRVELK
jgi:hypothetical protein